MGLLIINDAILEIIKNPDIRDEKKEDLAGTYVYKFKFHHQQFLLADERDSTQRLLLALGLHENFYQDLKRIK